MMVVRQFCLAVILTLAGLACSTDLPELATSWNNSKLTLKIPKDFPPNIPIFTIALLSGGPSTPSSRSPRGRGGPREKQYLRSSESGRLLRDNHFKFGDRGGSTLGELRLPTHPDDAGVEASVWEGRSGSRGGGRNLGADLGRPSDGRGSSGGGGGGGPSRLVLLENPNHLFNPRLDRYPDSITLSLQRPMNLSDYSSYAGDRVEVFIGPNGTERGRNGRRQDGRRENVLEVKLIITDAIDCARPKENACFLPEGNIRLWQWENRPPVTLLSLPSPREVCPNLRPKYSLRMEGVDGRDEELATKSETLVIRPTASLDREKRGTDLRFTISCILRDGKRAYTKDANLIVLDEDDSPPVKTRNPTFYWNVETIRYESDAFIVLDHDLSFSNNYKAELRGNTYGLVRIESVGKFSVKKDLCINEAENVTDHSFSAECTLLSPMVYFEPAKLTKSVPSSFTFNVVFIDKSLIPSVYPPDKPSANQVSYEVILTIPRATHDPPPVKIEESEMLKTASSALPIVEYNKQVFDKLMKHTPPIAINVTINMPVRKYHRIHQLIEPDIDLNDFTAHLPPNATFYIPQSSEGQGIKVSPVTGIVHVDDPDLLTEGEMDLIVERGDSYSQITITILPPVDSTQIYCGDKDTLPENAWCSMIEFKSECTSSCGLSSGATCSWRPFQDQGHVQSTHYGTCSPNLDTCPNGVCDELELKYKGICPQDCIDESWLSSGQHVKLGPTGRGIASALGVCTCNEQGCSCFPSYITKPPSPDPSDDPSITHAPAVWSCGKSCMILLGLLIFFLLLIPIIGIVFCKMRCNRGMKQKGGVISLGTLANDERPSSLPYHTRDETHDTFLHAIRSSPRPEHHPFPALNITIDRKWEFPRSRLVIEQTLGEGEFGKVMRARAQNINGTLGYTTVAVKMLKSNSTPTELNDLLSEYSLLKEVSHPNVIKLLGACTVKGGPIYIIIEYCQYGSLRNYLKRSRHAEFENRVGSGPADGTAADYAVVPKDILSFAWQICKGMAYLTDMKLVHRDLAARNVLLASGKQCKISDFGLTRDVYEGDLYFKRSKGRVPVKWMALESLVDHMYTSKSDVWSFGVLMWELVTLGTPPYPGVTPERLFSLLKAGYRMEKPENCSQELYDVMLQCWAEDPARRPTFKNLTDIFEDMIQADVEYLELRSLIVTNRGYFDAVPAPPQQFQDPPQHIQEVPQQFQDSPQISHSSPQIQQDDSPSPAEAGWTPPEEHLDSDSYLMARTDLRRPLREESTEPLLAATTPTNGTASQLPTITTSHAHNPAYSPTSDTTPHPLHYSTLATRPDEEDAHNLTNRPDEEYANNLDCCRSEDDSDSGRATGDSGYATEEGRGRWRSEHKGMSRAPMASPQGSSYSPIPHQDDPDQDDDQDTSEDLEERQELLTEDSLGHLTPSPEPTYTAHNTRTAHCTRTAHNTRTAHANHAAHNAHTTPVIV